MSCTEVIDPAIQLVGALVALSLVYLMWYSCVLASATISRWLWTRLAHAPAPPPPPPLPLQQPSMAMLAAQANPYISVHACLCALEALMGGMPGLARNDDDDDDDAYDAAAHRLSRADRAAVTLAARDSESPALAQMLRDVAQLDAAPHAHAYIRAVHIACTRSPPHTLERACAYVASYIRAEPAIWSALDAHAVPYPLAFGRALLESGYFDSTAADAERRSFVRSLFRDQPPRVVRALAPAFFETRFALAHEDLVRNALVDAKNVDALRLFFERRRAAAVDPYLDWARVYERTGAQRPTAAFAAALFRRLKQL